MFHDASVWQIDLAADVEMRGWLDRPTITGPELIVFVRRFNARSKNPQFRCDLSIETDFFVTLTVERMLKQSIDVCLTSNRPQLQSALTSIRGNDQDLISGTTILSGWRPKLRGRLLDMARSGQTTTLKGDELLAFIQDEVTPSAHHLGVDIPELRRAYPILDGTHALLTWKLEYELARGVGAYSAVPYLQIDADVIKLEKIDQIATAGVRFARVGERWLELTPLFKARVSAWRQQGVSTIPLAPQEVMGSYRARIEKFGLYPPRIEPTKGDREGNQARVLIDTLRRHGLPVGLYGFRQWSWMHP